MKTVARLFFFTALLTLLAPGAQAQQSQMFGPYELHYSVVNTTFLTPAIASTYGITRAKKRAILNLAVRRHEGDESTPIPMLLKGKTWDLIQNQFLTFKEVREGAAIYYIAEFSFINEEWRFFEVNFRPEGATRTYTFKLRHQLYTD